MHQQILAMGLTFAEEKKKCQFPANSVTFTEEILNGKLHFSCSDNCERVY